VNAATITKKRAPVTAKFSWAKALPVNSGWSAENNTTEGAIALTVENNAEPNLHSAANATVAANTCAHRRVDMNEMRERSKEAETKL